MKVFKHTGGNGCTVFSQRGIDAPLIEASAADSTRPRQRILLFDKGICVAEYTVSLAAAPRTIIAIMRNNFQPLGR